MLCKLIMLWIQPHLEGYFWITFLIFRSFFIKLLSIPQICLCNTSSLFWIRILEFGQLLPFISHLLKYVPLKIFSNAYSTCAVNLVCLKMCGHHYYHCKQKRVIFFFLIFLFLFLKLIYLFLFFNCCYPNTIFFQCTGWWPSYTYMYTFFFLTSSCSIISD